MCISFVITGTCTGSHPQTNGEMASNNIGISQQYAWLLKPMMLHIVFSPCSPTNMQQWQYPHRQISGGLFFQATSVQQRNESQSCLTILDALFENHHTLSKNQIEVMLNNAIILIYLLGGQKKLRIKFKVKIIWGIKEK